MLDWRTTTVLAASGLLALSGCSKPGKFYDQSPAAAEAALAGSHIPELALGGVWQSGPASVNGANVTWQIGPAIDSENASSSADKQTLRMVAHVEPDGAGSRITTDILPGTDSSNADFAKRKAKIPAAIDLLDAIAAEQVDSTLGHRQFDMAAINAQMVVAMLAMIPQIQNDMNKAAAAQEAQDREDAKQRAFAGDNDQNARPSNPEANAAPMDDTQPVNENQSDN